MIKIKTISSLEKPFWDNENGFFEIDNKLMLKNQLSSYQVVFNIDEPVNGRAYANVSVDSDIKNSVVIKQVGHVPCAFLAYEQNDNYLRTEPGFYPDVLQSFDSGVNFINKRWNTLWVEIDSANIPVGEHYINIDIESGENKGQSKLPVIVYDATLPETDLTVTQWFHCDGICNYHNVKMFTPQFFEIAEQYVKMAVKYGINTILTPLFTPPLDTAEGTSRKTCQLVDVIKNGDTYTFSYNNLDKWIKMCDDCGVKYFEMAHLFTQWGAHFAPKIMALENSQVKQIFGWDTKSDSKEYISFLSQFLVSLKGYIYNNNLQNRCYLHVSDEPDIGDCENYLAASKLVHEHLPQIPIMDAISSFELYEKSSISHPVVAIDHIEKFLSADTENLFAYYCCAQKLKVTNRFIAMPSYRNRVFGLQCYIYNLRGFLQWGYNFYNSMLSISPIDPYAVTDAQMGFPAGDPFSVYPTKDG
ncbi:MAG: DUF4091 domain-containing protein, partial [Oscillospiraceae bacterium]